ncbi:MAG: hypothetical protein RKE49_01445 [Oceanicaulis sp.]
MIALESGTDELNARDRALLAELREKDICVRLSAGFVDLKSGSVAADAVSVEWDTGTLTLAPVTVASADGKNCVERMGVTRGTISEAELTEVKLFEGWVREIELLVLLEDGFLEHCQAGVRMTAYSRDEAFIYLADPTEPDSNPLMISRTAPAEWPERDWKYVTTPL